MNIYLIQEEEDFKYFQAQSMQDAITVATQQFCKEEYDDTWSPEDSTEDESPDVYYQRVILQSCSLIGELANP